MPTPLVNCYNCRLPASMCACTRCVSCGVMAHIEDICASCRNCTVNGCCACYRCSHDGCTYTSHASRNFCRDCGQCPAHCNCYVCRVCNVRLEPNQRQTSLQIRNAWHGQCHCCVEHCNCYRCGYVTYDSLGDVETRCSHRGNINSLCTNCSRCPEHCHCTSCSLCERRVMGTDIHSTCGVCSSCCVCSAVGVKFRNGKFQFHNSSFSKGEFKNNKLRRHIAVELEINRYATNISSSAVNLTINRWGDAVVRDGSIGEAGFEIPTNPTNGDKFLNHMRELTTGLAAIRAGCNESCGLHVHVNVKGDILMDKKGVPILGKDKRVTFDKSTAYSQYDLRRLTLLYQRVEMAMFLLCDDRRLTSRYSAVCGDYWAGVGVDHKKFRKDLLTKMYFDNVNHLSATKEHVHNNFGNYRGLGETLKSKKSHKYEQVRYKALNIHSYFMRGTIEFRHHEGTADYDEIVNWSLICATIVDKASRMSDSEINNLPLDSTEALLAILPENLQEYCKRKWKDFDTRDSWARYRLILQDKFPGQTVLSNLRLPNTPSGMGFTIPVTAQAASQPTWIQNYASQISSTLASIRPDMDTLVNEIVLDEV